MPHLYHKSAGMKLKVTTHNVNLYPELRRGFDLRHTIVLRRVQTTKHQGSLDCGQIILALGNYMNSSKRGAVYGFKLQSLDLVRG